MRNLRKTCNDNGENLLFQTIADPLENVTQNCPLSLLYVEEPHIERPERAESCPTAVAGC
jgi:hypothetical protein